MKTSETGIQMLKNFEGCKLKSYKDTSGIITIGYGHTGNVKENDKITLQQAEDYFKEDLINAEIPANAVNTTLLMKEMQLIQNNFDALVCLIFNIGSTRFSHSNLFNQLVTDPKHHAIIVYWMQYVFSGKNVSICLVQRRSIELAYFFSSVIISL